MVETAQSSDGTIIAFERAGEGATVILVGGAVSGRLSGAELSASLAESFTSVAYDRRGRGDSTDNEHNSSDADADGDARRIVDLEVNDLDALITAVSPGSAVYLYGHSSGAILALEAAARDLPIAGLVAYEPPYTKIAHDGRQTPSREWGRSIRGALDQGDREAATELFMRGTGMDAESIEFAKQAPFWTGMVEIADSARYDLALVDDGAIPVGRLSRIRVPTLVLAGARSPDWMRQAAEGAAAAVPHGTYRSLQGQTHQVSTEVLAPVLVDCFTAM